MVSPIQLGQARQSVKAIYTTATHVANQSSRHIMTVLLYNVKQFGFHIMLKHATTFGKFQTKSALMPKAFIGNASITE